MAGVEILVLSLIIVAFGVWYLIVARPVPLPTRAGMSDEIGDDFAMTEKLLRVMSSRCTDPEHSGCLDPNRAAYVFVRAADLREKFIKHMRACQAEYPEMTDKNAIFQAWAVQYLAHLEYFTLDLTKRVIALEGKRRYGDPIS